MRRYLIVFLASAVLPAGICFGLSSGLPDVTVNADAPLNTLGQLLKMAHLEQSGFNVEYLSGPGFCNTLYKLQEKDPDAGPHGRSMVAKVFSQLAIQRLDPSVAVAHVDLLASDRQLGPELLAASKHGILMDRIEGRELMEAVVHGTEAEPLCKSMAECVARFHLMDTLKPDRPNMLWHSINVMLSLCESNQRIPVKDSEWTSLDLRQEVIKLRDCIEGLDLPLVLGHGDLKPSNVIVTDALGVRLIDFELSGAHYRGFDVAKLFRTSKSTLSTETNRQTFIKAYVDETCRLTARPLNREHEAALLTLESKIMVPLTWLEATIFFQCMRRMDPSRDAKWVELASDRLGSYKNNNRKWDSTVGMYRALRGI